MDEDREAGSPDPVVDSIEQSFGRLFGRVRGMLRDAAATLGPDVQPAGWIVLRFIVRNGSAQAGAIAAATGMDKSAVSRQLRDLRERGLVTVEPSPTDARAILVTPTADGLHRVRTITEAWSRRFRDVLESWTDEELRGFAALLERLADSGPWAASDTSEGAVGPSRQNEVRADREGS